jgi:FKBP-type peptidyl-prolyl cis-trans isomerase
MKIKFLLTSLIIVLLFNSCSKDKGCVQNPVSAEKASMVAYCSTNNINYTEHSSGILYEIITPGASIRPTLDSKVFMYYTGKLLDGTTFDYQADPTKTGWQLKNLIEGWQIGLPLIQQGGHIKLVIPSSLAYGCTGSGSIPANSPLFFDITVTLVQP